MLSESIRVGDRVEIASKNELKKFYISQVEKVLDSERFIVHIPISYGQLVKLNVEQSYYFLFFTDKGIIQFEASIAKVFKENTSYLMQIQLLSQGERVQRREFFRFPCLLPLKFTLIDENNPELQMEMYQGIIKDISGGGLRYVSNADIAVNSKAKFLIALGDELIVAIGKVLHKQYFRKSTYKYQYRVIFIGILSQERERIVRYILNEQRRLSRKTIDWSEKNE